ncbi:MAG: hypothetical protein M1813_000907 [Trichoglossum hirsutum]|nr:MAG: hypothetical protein M1813_000907 [Trichoglossum hirsutum]
MSTSYTTNPFNQPEAYTARDSGLANRIKVLSYAEPVNLVGGSSYRYITVARDNSVEVVFDASLAIRDQLHQARTARSNYTSAEVFK